MKYTAEKVRDYADACRLAHKGPVIADMLTELAERIKVDESAAPVGFVMEATATRHKFGLLTQDLPPGAELFTHPPAQAAQGEASPGRCKACGRATRAVGDGLDGNGLGCTNAPPIDLAAVREVIESHINEAKNLRHDPELQDYLYEQADKLEAAIKGEG